MFVKKIFGVALFAILMLLCVHADALHIKGGWFSYAYLGKTSGGNFQYRVTLRVYRDCAPPNPGQNDTQINFSIFANGSNARIAEVAAPLTANYPLSKSSYSECLNPRPEVCYVILEYSAVVELSASNSGYTIAFQRCCRINGIVNVLQPSNALGNSYSITIPGNSISQTYPENSSPVFSQRDTLVVCYNSAMVLDYSAIDTDGDSLVYYFTDALNGASQNIPNPTSAPPPPYGSLPYAPGYTPTNPFGTNVSINDRTGLITGISPATTGEYVVAVAIDEYRNGIKIATTRKELHVNVANCAIVAAKLPISISSCDGFTVSLENLSTSPAILSYFWDFGVGNTLGDTSASAVPTFTYPDTGVYRAKLIVNKGYSCSDSAFTDVKVFPGFFPGFVADGSCFSNPFQFIDTSKTRYGFINSWRWDFGNTAVTNDTSLLRNPTYRYPTPGSYNVNFIVGSNKGCADTLLVPVTVSDRPLLSLPNDTLICSIDTLQLNAIGTGSFTWDPSPSLINRNVFNPLVFPKDTTKYFVTLNDRGCLARDSITVNVLDFITVNAGPDSTICLTDGIRLNPTTQALSFNWQPAGIMDNSRVKNPIATPTSAITNVVIVANLGKCQDRDSLVLRTVPYSIADAGASSTICFSDSVRLVGTSNASRYTWSPANLVLQPNSLQTSTRSLSQNTTFTLTVTDTLGCPKPVTDVVAINVRPRINVFAGNDTSVVIGQPLQFNAVSNGLLFRWVPGTALSNTTILNPVATFRSTTLPQGQDAITYTLTASTPEGCVGSDDIVVRIFKTPPSIFVPTGFTPNNDGLNDVIKPILAGMQRLDYFRVYNRYGQLVFESQKQNTGWDGRLKGNLQSSNAYVYQCQAIDYEGKIVSQKGTFTLIR